MTRSTVSVLTVLLAAVPALAAPTPAQKCEANKNLTAGKYAACLEKAASKLVVSGDIAKYDAATAKCAEKFSLKWAKVESAAAGACPTNGDEADVEAAVRAHADAVAQFLGGSGNLAGCDGGGAGFVDNGDGTILDEARGLQWEKKVGFDYAPQLANLNDADNPFRWADVCSLNAAVECQPSAAAAAACNAGAVGSTLSCALCGPAEGTCDTYGGSTVWQWLVDLNTGNFAGHNDWRLPTNLELATLADYEDTTFPTVDPAFHAAGCGPACLDVTDPNCSCTHPNAHWAANVYVSTPYMSWYVNFYDGNVSATSQSQTGRVRAVRDL